MKPLMDYAPFKIGERFEDEEGDVLKFVSDQSYVWSVVDGEGTSRGPWRVDSDGCGYFVKPLDRTSEALDELAQLDADEICGPKPWREPREFWIAEREGKMVEVHCHVSDAIHVREVTE